MASRRDPVLTGAGIAFVGVGLGSLLTYVAVRGLPVVRIGKPAQQILKPIPTHTPLTVPDYHPPEALVDSELEVKRQDLTDEETARAWEEMQQRMLSGPSFLDEHASMLNA